MKVNAPTERFTVPVAFVTKGRQRIKQYDNSTVYLNNGDEFEIELFNPTANKVMAKIDLNGVSIGPGVVLRPGERVFLERYLSEAKKFLYSTYEVDGDNPDVKRAIANNGDVAIKFYCETPPPQPVIAYANPWWTTITTTPWYGPTFNYFNSSSGISGTLKNTGSLTGTANCNNINSTLTSSNSMGGAKQCFSSRKLEPQSFAGGQSMDFADNFSPSNETLYSASVDYAPEMMSRSIVDVPKSVETGRIEKGSNSNQSFTYDHSSFNTYWTWKTVWKILPTSQKPVVREDLTIYCTNCQAKRRRGSHKFCPICGNQY